jgi:hypothetical protein
LPNLYEQERLLDELTEEIKCAKVSAPKAGYEALQLRVLYSTAVAWLNVGLFALQCNEERAGSDEQAGCTGPPPVIAEEAWIQAVSHTHRLIALLENILTPSSTGPSREIREFAQDMRAAAHLLRQTIMDMGEPDPNPDVSQPVEAAWLRRKALYDRACYQAVGKPKRPTGREELLRLALRDLDRAELARVVSVALACESAPACERKQGGCQDVMLSRAPSVLNLVTVSDPR